jgi:hypothetical protein
MWMLEGIEYLCLFLSLQMPFDHANLPRCKGVASPFDHVDSVSIPYGLICVLFYGITENTVVSPRSLGHQMPFNHASDAPRCSCARCLHTFTQFFKVSENETLRPKASY